MKNLQTGTTCLSSSTGSKQHKCRRSLQRLATFVILFLCSMTISWAQGTTTDFNKTFEKVTETIPETVAVKGDFTITTAEHDVETYKMGADSIEDNIKVLEEYGAMLDALKARGADESTLSSILNMDIEEGMEFGSKLLNMSDQAWNSYFDSLERLHKTAAEISAKYYQDEVDSLKENSQGGRVPLASSP